MSFIIGWSLVVSCLVLLVLHQYKPDPDAWNKGHGLALPGDRIGGWDI